MIRNYAFYHLQYLCAKRQCLLLWGRDINALSLPLYYVAYLHLANKILDFVVFMGF